MNMLSKKAKPLVMTNAEMIAICDDRRLTHGYGSFWIYRPIRYHPDVGEPGPWLWNKDKIKIIGDPSRYCHISEIGGFLWLKETWAILPSGCIYKVGRGIDDDRTRGWKWMSPVSMPQWASRMVVQIVGIRPYYKRRNANWLWSLHAKVARNFGDTGNPR